MLFHFGANSLRFGPFPVPKVSFFCRSRPFGTFFGVISGGFGVCFAFLWDFWGRGPFKAPPPAAIVRGNARPSPAHVTTPPSGGHAPFLEATPPSGGGDSQLWGCGGGGGASLMGQR